jgi:chromosomal replication initiation ATPase DnaA
MRVTTREFDFHLGTGYEPFVLEVAQQVLRDPGRTHSPLFLVGPTRSGKSTYLKGIAEGLNERLAGPVFEVTSAFQFRREYLESYRKNTRKTLVCDYQDRQGLLLDDLQELADSPESLAALASIANSLLKAEKPIVFASSWTPRRLQTFLELSRGLAPRIRLIRLQR